MNRTDINIRDWRDSDIESAAGLALRNWPEIRAHVSESFVRDYIRLYRLESTWTRTVTAESEPVGLIFARLDRDYRWGARLKAVWSTWWLMLSVIIGRYGRSQHHWTFTRTLISDELRVRRLRPAADGEVTLLLLDEKYQRQGIGRELMEDFIETARSRGARKVSLFTDEESNWRFYERLGWERVREFYLDFDSFLVGRKVTGFAYTFDIK